ncbi:uncharacterized protein LOC117644812 [Thrips palmi]|uniref:Uncharacterized protein LOC117644812 n=1 Tax=Thrips palmi TaxID=161013 RepID=A0A6P8YTB7_THRPL|nr:uncharacterized protein LOC117644812 [Thrips palmi]
MLSRTLLVVLVAACSAQTLNAWPWDRKTTTTTTTPAPAVMSREKFLARLSQATETVTAEVAKSHQLVEEADAADKEGKAMKKAVEDVRAYTKAFTDELNDYAARFIKNGIDTAPCVERYMDNKAEIEAYSDVEAKEKVKLDMQDVRDTAVEADALLEKIASVKARGEAEAAKPDGEYGGDVDAILKDADELVSTAVWNNKHIDVMVDRLMFAADVTIFLSYAPEDIKAALNCGALCMRRADRSRSLQYAARLAKDGSC